MPDMSAAQTAVIMASPATVDPTIVNLIPANGFSNSLQIAALIQLLLINMGLGTPSNPVTPHYVLDTTLNAVVASYNQALINLASSVPAAQVQSAWNQTDNTKADYIKSKPPIQNYIPPVTSTPSQPASVTLSLLSITSINAEMVGMNGRYNTLAAKVDDLATKFNTLIAELTSYGVLKST